MAVVISYYKAISLCQCPLFNPYLRKMDDTFTAHPPLQQEFYQGQELQSIANALAEELWTATFQMC